MKKILIIFSILILLMAGIGSVVYYKYKQSPLYSLKSAVVAVKTGNKMLLDKYIDFEGIIGTALEEELSKNKELADNPFAHGMLALMKPALTSMLKEAFYAEIQSSINRTKEETLNMPAKNSPSTPSVNSVKSVKTLQKDGNIATVEIIFVGKQQQDIPLVIGMQKMENYWQIKQIVNFEEFTKAVDFDLQKAVE